MHIKKGTGIGIVAHDIHMDETYYQDPKAFEPGRFMSSRSKDTLEGSDPQQTDEAEYKYEDKTFSSGSPYKQKSKL